ncbi:MAG: PilZ domain-containing protein [Candidatus Omnitrophota bacterium]
MKVTVVLLFLFVFINQAVAAVDTTEKFPAPASVKKTGDETKIVISASGHCKFTSYRLDNPPRIVVEFQSKNVFAEIDEEILVNEGIIKKVITGYYEKAEGGPLKSLTFELSEGAPYEIWQEDNAILINIKVPDGAPSASASRQKIITQDEGQEQIGIRLNAMDKALTRIIENNTLSLEIFLLPAEFQEGNFIKNEFSGRRLMEMSGNKAGRKENFFYSSLPQTKGLSLSAFGEKTYAETLSSISPAYTAVSGREGQIVPQTNRGNLFWPVGAVVFSGLIIFSVRCKWKKLDYENKVKNLMSQLQKKDERLEQEKMIRKAVEQAGIRLEREYKQLKDSIDCMKEEIERKNKSLMRKEIFSKEKERDCLQKQKECEELRNSMELIKKKLVINRIMDESVSLEDGEAFPVKSQSGEKRNFSRLDLSRDYDRTVLLRVTSEDKAKSIKCFAGNIGMGGLCFRVKTAFDEEEILSLRLFFFGERIPMMKVKAKIVWMKKVLSFNYYGVYFISQKEEDGENLKYYIESKLVE